MIGYYVHHVGLGHLHRARALAMELGRHGESVTGLSSLSRPADWPGDWVRLRRDDDGTITDPTARGVLHWAPLGHGGLRTRMADIAAWIDRAAPSTVVVDVSVEVLLLARLLGVPTVAVVLPGVRGDRAHLLGLESAQAVVGFWPATASAMLSGLPSDLVARTQCVGALSRFPVTADPAARPPRERGRRHGVLMLGAGGTDLVPDDMVRLRTSTPGWSWTILDGGPQAARTDPWAALRSSDVVVTHAGQNAIAETAAARRPAVVVPQDRPYDEQRSTAQVLSAGPWPVVTRPSWASPDWAAVLDQTAELDGRLWASWCDGRAARRFAEVVSTVGAVR
jgi:hypothetical protein